MNPAHLHLLITHLPIFGSLLGGIVLAQGLWTKSDQTKIAAYTLLIISFIAAVIGYVSGEGAEEIVEKIQGVSEDIIERHSDFAAFALAGLIVLGISSIAGLVFTYRQSPMKRQFAFLTLFISLISFGLVVKTGYLGGQIRHTELNSSSINSVQGHDYQNDKDDDNNDKDKD